MDRKQTLVWRYGGIHLNKDFIFALSKQTWQRISQENDTPNKDAWATKSNSECTKNLYQDTLEIKIKNPDELENISFSIFKENKIKTS